MSNWYVRRSRERFWAKGMEQDKINAYMTLYTALVTVVQDGCSDDSVHDRGHLPEPGAQYRQDSSRERSSVRASRRCRKSLIDKELEAVHGRGFEEW